MKPTKFYLAILIVLMTLAISQSFAQPLPQYELSVKNPVLIGNVYQFDLYLKRLGDTNFRIGNSQFIMTFNGGQFVSSAISRVYSSEQIGTGYFFDQEIIDNQIRITLGGNGSYTNATDISAISNGTRISSFQITGVNVPILFPQLIWVNLPNLVRTGLSEIDVTDNYYDITDVTDASHINGGSEFGRISGFKFNDLNGNGVWDQPAEPPIDGWTIILTGSNGILSSITGNGAWSDGYYEFVNLTPGEYSIDEVSKTNWSKTTLPTNPIALASGDNLQNMNFGNYNGPAVLGLVFNDNDGSSTRDNGEGGLAGCMVLANKVGGGGSKSTVTNSIGDYSFIFSPSESGLWVFSQTPQTGWVQTYPIFPSTYMIDIQSGTYVTGRDFGNFRTCSVSGMKFNDYNRDSSKQTFEPGIVNWRIRLLKNGIQVDSVLTDVNGDYTFLNLTVGTYTVTEAHNTGWAQTYPPPPGVHTVVFNSGGINFIGKYFGNYHIIPVGGIGQIGGKKFEDMNGNKIKDPEDNGLPGWKIRLYAGNMVIDSQLTNVNGNYLFQDLDDGIYSVSEAEQTNWHQTFPGGTGSYDITIGLSQRIFIDNDFGNYQLGSISGVAYSDSNHNGSQEGGESGMAGLHINAAGPEGAMQATTGVGGVWSFTNLIAGSYTISEEIPIGYHLTEPVDGTYIVSMISGMAQTGLKFGNSAAADTNTYRTFSYDSMAHAQDLKGRIGYIKRIPNKVEFCANFTNQTNHKAYFLRVYFRVPIYINDPRYPFNVNPTPTSITVNTILNRVDMTWADSIPNEGVVKICAWGKAGKLQIGSFFFSRGYIKMNQISAAQFTLNQLRFPMPNAANVYFEDFLQNGFGRPDTGGLVVGIPRRDSSRAYGWVRIRSASDILKSFSDRTGFHTDSIHGFCVRGRYFIKEQKFLQPRRHNNRVFADLASLKINIVASKLGITPVGLGELIFDDGVNPLSGKTLTQLVNIADSMLTFWRTRVSTDYINIDSVIRKINWAFEGPIDTESFAQGLRFKGVRKLMDIPFLRANPNITPAVKPMLTILEEKLPKQFQLYQNYPNPFNPTTTIEFELLRDAEVDLKIYNVVGQLVRTLIDAEQLDAGPQEIEFDASDIASGLYFYSITIHELGDENEPGLTYRDTKKMILMK